METEILPPLSTTDYQSLVINIAKDGQQIPIIIDSKTGEIIDGHHRILACKELKIEPKIEQRQFATPHDAERAKIMLNLARRNLSNEQRNEVIAKLRKKNWTQQEIAEVMGISRFTVSTSESIITNVEINNSNKIDLRYKLTPRQKEEIYQHTHNGQIQEQIAADYGVSQPTISKIIAKKENEKKRIAYREKLIQEGIQSGLPENIDIWEGDFRQLGDKIIDDSISLIFTDPPYAEEYIPLYGDLAKLGARVLKPGGSLICYVGHYALPEIFPLMIPHLRFWWINAVLHKASRQLPGKWITAEWKPLLWFVKENRANNNYVHDTIPATGPEKDMHDWQQSINEALYLIEQLTDPNELILDPMCGSGTTLLAALQIHRRGLGIEISPSTVAIAKGRINAAIH